MHNSRYLGILCPTIKLNELPIVDFDKQLHGLMLFVPELKRLLEAKFFIELPCSIQTGNPESHVRDAAPFPRLRA